MSRSSRAPSLRRRPRGGRYPALAALGLAGLTAAALLFWLERTPPTPTPTPSAGALDAATWSACPAGLPPAPPAGELLAFVGAHAGTPGMPTMRGEYGGCSFAVLVDTGVSGGNAFLGWFAREMHLEAHAGERTLVDIAGTSGTVLEVAPVTVHLPGIQTGVPIGMVMPSGDRLRADGIAAVISPRYTVADGRTLALEFGEPSRLRNLPSGVADALHEGTAPTFDLTECDGHFQARAMVAGRDARLEIDTGSMATVVYAGSTAGAALTGSVGQWRQAGRGAIGGNAVAATLEGVPIRVGPLTVTSTVEVMVAKPTLHAPCDFDGVLGADFLVAHRCALLVEVERLRGWCEP